MKIMELFGNTVDYKKVFHRLYPIGMYICFGCYCF